MVRKCRQALVFLLLIIILANLVFLLQSIQWDDGVPATLPVPVYNTPHLSRKDRWEFSSNLHRPQQSKLILAYTTIYGRIFNVSVFGRTGSDMKKAPNPLELCKHKCMWSTNKDDYNKSDAVLFHLYNNLQNKDFVVNNLPPRYDVNQKWILMSREPQAFFYPEQLRLLDDKFNLTMTFQNDSDVVIPYGMYWQLSDAAIARRAKVKLDYMNGKEKGIAWVVSNCKTSSRREEYVRELQKYISVDIYGKCGNLTTKTKDANGFRQMIAKQYKFYIAFENSDCDDYVSEKFWNSLHIGMIPIVRGHRANYKKAAPQKSYIHADSFLTPQRLAEYLLKISSNSELFHKHHEWRRTYDANYQFFTVNHNWMCDLCERVHNSPTKTVSIYDHFSEDTRCMTYLDADMRNRQNEQVEDILRM